MKRKGRGNLTVDDPLIQEAIRKGLVTVTGGPPLEVAHQPKPRKRPAQPALVVGGYRPEIGVWLFPIRTVSEANRVKWREKSNRTKQAREAVSRAVGRDLRALLPVAEAYHAGRSIRLLFTRLGSIRLDSCNLSVSMKATEDALALMMGASDGAANWHSSFEQDPAHPAVGVSVAITIDGAIPAA